MPLSDKRRAIGSGNLSISNLLYKSAVVIIFLIIGLMIWSFLKNNEKVSILTYELRPQVTANSFYAAELLINRLHGDKGDPIATTLLDSNLKMLLKQLPALPTGDDPKMGRPTLIINSMGSNMSAEYFNTLRQWVEDGGHLITFTSGFSKPKDVQAVVDYLQNLNADQATAHNMVTDATFKALIDELDAGNKFLAKLGVYAVAADDAMNNTELLDTQLQSIIDNLNNQNTNGDDASYIQAIKRLKESQPVSILLPKVEGYVDTKIANTQPQQIQFASNDVLLVKTDNQHRHLSDAVLKMLYADKMSVPNSNRSGDANSEKGSANINTLMDNEASGIYDAANPDAVRLSHNDNFKVKLIRVYLQNQRQHLASAMALLKSAQQSDTVSTNSQSMALQQKKASQLGLFIKVLLDMDDKRLLTLFKPIDEVYIDRQFGQGRLSVIIDSDVMTNPNPNIVLPKKRAGETSGFIVEDIGSENILPVTLTIQELLDDSYSYQSVNLFSTDNASWLSYLTQDSSQVWILPNTDVDILPVILWKQARFAVLGLALLMLVWLASLYNRFGKMQTLSQGHTLDILNYFRQVGRFGWQQDGANKLAEVSVERTRQRAAEVLMACAPIHHLKDKQFQGFESATDTTTKDPVRLTKSTVNFDDLEHIKVLHELLLARFEDIKQLKGGHPMSNFANTSFATNNATAIKTLIVPRRLRQALSPTLPTSTKAKAANFTEMTQTLWIINWLLK